MPTTTPAGRRHTPRALTETLEGRRLLSASALPIGLLGTGAIRHLGWTLPKGATVPAATKGSSHKGTASKSGVAAAAAAAVAAPYSPAQIRHFYGVDNISFGGVAGDGTGQTIAIIAVDNEPNIKADLATFDAHFGLAAPPSFVVENQNGATSPLPASNADYGEETALDVEYAHAMAPGANLLLIEITDNAASDPAFFTTFISTGVNRANLTAGVSVVTMSYGAADYSGEASNDSYFQTPGITYLAAAGDDGSADTDYPATSPYVVAVGGTSIYPADTTGTYGSETTWNESSLGEGATGGGISTYESKPAYQSNVTQSATKRTSPDVAIDADPETGVDIYDSYGEGGYVQIGGTSLSSPLMAGLIAVANQGRARVGLASLTGSTQTLPRLYQLPSSDFHDITAGNNKYPNATSVGYSAGAGYDLTTGLGTPIANKLIPDLAGDATVTGRAFADNNANGAFDGTDSAISTLAGQTVYLDLNNNGVRDATGVSAEPTATIAANGTFTFASLVTGGDLVGGLTGTVRLASGTPAGYVLVGTGSTFTTAYATASAANVGLFPTAYADAAANDAYTVQLSPSSSTTLQILVNGSVAYTAPASLVASSGLSFALNGTGESLAVDLANGNPVPTGGLSVVGGGAANGNTLAILGSGGNDTVAFNGGIVQFATGGVVHFSNVANLSVNLRGGTDALTVNADTVTVPAQTAGGGILTRAFSSLGVGPGAGLRFATAAAHADRTVVVVAAGGLSISSTAAQLDLGANDLIARGGTLGTVAALAAGGFANGAWTGYGLASSAAAADAKHLTALGVATAATAAFDGQSVSAADVLVKYTYYGDTNLDGAVNAADYTRTDVGYVTHLSGWANGDFNYDGAVDGSDYALIDNAFNQQTQTL